MGEIKLDNDNFILFQRTPWEERVLSKKTNEITQIVYKDENHLHDLFQKFSHLCLDEKIEFTAGRFDMSDQILKRQLLLNGFYFAEVIFQIVQPDLIKSNFFSSIKNRLELTYPDEQDYDQIKKIAYDSFQYGRIFEDPFIPEEKARQRKCYIVEDLIRQKQEFLVYKCKGEVVAFHIQEVRNDEAYWILTATRKDFTRVAYMLWASCLDNLKIRKVKRARGQISAANIGAVNIHSFFGFKFEKALMGFHRQASFYNRQ